ncbi:polysaccharide deacetylase family protein [Prescottella defluvii]|nr:polysaccharide deacetylase family protein [Prescottella defluvii]
MVSLTFDDGNADATVAAQTLQAHGLHGTFFVPSGYVDQPGTCHKPNFAVSPPRATKSAAIP